MSKQLMHIYYYYGKHDLQAKVGNVTVKIFYCVLDWRPLAIESPSTCCSRAFAVTQFSWPTVFPVPNVHVTVLGDYEQAEP